VIPKFPVIVKIGHAFAGMGKVRIMPAYTSPSFIITLKC